MFKQTLMTGVTANATGVTVERPGALWSYQASIAGTGAVSCTVTVQVSNDGSNWLTFGTMTLSGTGSAVDSLAGDAPWAYHRAATSAISGTGATVAVNARGQ